jgi:hypothetical protein
MAGVVGAMLNSSQQLGCAAGLAIATSILTTVDSEHGGPDVFTGRAASFWFMLALVVVVAVPVALFMSNNLPSPDALEEVSELGKIGNPPKDIEGEATE